MSILSKMSALASISILLIGGCGASNNARLQAENVTYTPIIAGFYTSVGASKPEPLDLTVTDSPDGWTLVLEGVTEGSIFASILGPIHILETTGQKVTRQVSETSKMGVESIHFTKVSNRSFHLTILNKLLVKSGSSWVHAGEEESNQTCATISQAGRRLHFSVNKCGEEQNPHHVAVFSRR